MISHEIGHIIFKTIEMDDDVIDREIKADSMAIQFNLNNELSSALQKMIDSGEYEDVKNDLYKRIEPFIGDSICLLSSKNDTRSPVLSSTLSDFARHIQSFTVEEYLPLLNLA